MSENEQVSVSRKAGALRSALNIALNTDYAINLWQGRPPEEEGEKEGKKKERRQSLIFSMPAFIQKAGRINADSFNDNPYADQKMLELETLLQSASIKMNEELVALKKSMSMLPPQATISEVNCASPLNIGVFSRTPLGYRCVWLLVGFDQLAMQAFQAAHYGFISRQELHRSLRRGGHLIRQIYGAAQKYRFFQVSRRDFALQNAQYHEAIRNGGEIDEAVLLGQKRSSFSPPVSKESIELLLAANAKADKADTVQSLEEPSEEQIVADLSLFVADSKRIDG
ncbi:PFL_4669 family integrating conjugative element protein [Salmonella enterica]|uniref:PFL_4669 family integrating conjugative element protein n=1 Tax=Salmonella enterica TaxID=28901 RepID=UPI001CFE27CD|nr:TIGR03761 family integrating conjugative element protein [Salmonella enterica]MCB4736067.1 TIGR03761 family integrating conjugative element protein [Salmonella enterica subsp. enterica serovar Mississippi]